MKKVKSKVILILAMLVSSVALSAQNIFPPSTIYVRKDMPSRTILYPEGFMAVKGQPVSLEGASSLPVDLSRSSVEVQYAGGSVTVPLNLVSVDASLLKNATAKRVLCFGESTTAMRCKDPYNASSKGKNWVMMAQEQLPESIRLTGNIGHGGWACYTYLNWPCAAKIDPNTPSSFFKPATMWYALGLAGKNSCEFNGSREQLSEIVLTPFGKYPMDGNAELWKLVQGLGKRNGYPPFDDDREYNGSKSQINALRAWAEELMDNPINEFYDKQTARKEDHAFSLEAYLKRSGEKAPDCVVINIGINDGDGANSQESSMLCFRRLMECFGDIPVAHFVNRWPGVCDKTLWAGFIPRQYDINGNTANLLRLQKGWREIMASRPQWYELDVWHLQYPASQLEEKLTSGGLDCSRNDVHTGFMGQQSSADQVVNWLLHVFAVTPREELLKDPTLALGNMHPYRVLGGELSPAPDGYELFYISHAGRHGSRYFDESSSRKRFMDMFRQYSQEKRFTKEGEMLYKDLQKIIKASEKNVGALSRLGEEELYQMGLRLDRNAGELFKGKGKKVVTYTTSSPRVMSTRDCLIDGLMTHNPMLRVDTVKFARKGKAHHEVVGYHLDSELKQLSNKFTVGHQQWKEYDPSGFLNRIFKEGCREGLDRDVVYRFFECGSACLSSGEKLPNILKYFSDYDLYNIWAHRAIGWVGRCTVSEQNKACRTLTMGRGIVDCIIEDADEVISGKSDVSATLRFTHDSYMVPLMSYMDIEGVNYNPVEDAVGNFRDYEFVSMGTNIQLFFYRNASGEILVRILMNERETLLASIAPVQGVFYRWADLKKFWVDRGVQLQKMFENQ